MKALSVVNVVLCLVLVAGVGFLVTKTESLTGRIDGLEKRLDERTRVLSDEISTAFTRMGYLEKQVTVAKPEPEKPKENHDARTAREAEIEEALDTKKVSVFFTETPISSVLQFLGDLTEIDFVYNLEKGAADPLITIRVNRITLRSLLNHLSTMSKIKWEVKDEAIYLYRDVPVPKGGAK